MEPIAWKLFDIAELPRIWETEEEEGGGGGGGGGGGEEEEEGERKW